MSNQRRLGRGLEALLSRAGEAVPPTPRLADTPEDGHPPDSDSDGQQQHGQQQHGQQQHGQQQHGQQSEHEGQAAEHRQPGGPSSPYAGDPGIAAMQEAMYVDIDRIDRNPYQPRESFDQAELDELADSIRTHGLLQPVVVRPKDQGRFELISGERRLRAAGMADWRQVPVFVRTADDRQVAELAIVENLQRKDLNPLEKAASFQRYLEQYGCTQEELAGRIQVDRSTIANLIRLLELPADVQHKLREGSIAMGHARALLPLGEEREQIEFCRRIIDQQLSVRATEELVQEAIHRADAEPLSLVAGGRAGGGGGSGRSSSSRSAHLAALEQQFRAALGAKVDLRQGAKGRGKIVIHFSSHEEFERLQAYLMDQAPSRQHGEAG